jgi:2-keto-4-pentenoate hydratase
VGWKLGFTNQALWAALGLDQPFWAPVYAETLASVYQGPERISRDRQKLEQFGKSVHLKEIRGRA